MCGSRVLGGFIDSSEKESSGKLEGEGIILRKGALWGAWVAHSVERQAFDFHGALPSSKFLGCDPASQCAVAVTSPYSALP